MKAVILLSGGLDSAVCAAIAKAEGWELHALTFDYGQIHDLELKAARKLARHFDVEEYRLIRVTPWCHTPLTGEGEVPKNRVIDETQVAPTYVPMRNTIFLSIAAGYAESKGIDDIFIGAHQVDYSGYPDCRRPYFDMLERALSLGSARWSDGKQRLRIHTPIIGYNKFLIVLVGAKYGVPFEYTWSCYDPTSDGKACGECDACQIRLRAFKDAGIEDPILYAKKEV